MSVISASEVLSLSVTDSVLPPRRTCGIPSTAGAPSFISWLAYANSDAQNPSFCTTTADGARKSPRPKPPYSLGMQSSAMFMLKSSGLGASVSVYAAVSDGE